MNFVTLFVMYVQLVSGFFLYFLLLFILWLLVSRHFRFGRLLLHLLTPCDTHTHTTHKHTPHTHTHTHHTPHTTHTHTTHHTHTPHTTHHTHTHTTHTHTHAHTLGRTPLDQGSAHPRDLYLKHKHSQEIGIFDPEGIWTRNPNKRTAADLLLTTRGCQDRHVTFS